MKEEVQSEWTKNISSKEQRAILKRMFQFAKPYRYHFAGAIIFAMLLSTTDVLLPKILEYYMDNYLTPKTATSQVIYFFAALYLFGVVIKSIVWFFQCFLYFRSSLFTFQFFIFFSRFFVL